MSIIDQLASSLGQRNELPNIALANSIVKGKDHSAVKELINCLSNKRKDIQSDSVKVLYEIGYLNPEMIAPYVDSFVSLINGKNNRLAWGAMSALDSICPVSPDLVAQHLPAILQAADHGSVITRDHAVGILTTLFSLPKFAELSEPLLIEQMAKSPANQLPKYAENASSFVAAKNKVLFINVLSERLPDIEKPSMKSRMEKVLKKLNKL
jgi:hypothetical protein